MESSRHNPQNSKKRVFSASSSSAEPDVMEIAPPLVNGTSNRKAKGKRKEVAYHEIIDVDMDEDCDDVVILEGKVESNEKAKVGMGNRLGSSSAAKLDSKKVASNKKWKEILVDPDHSSKGFNPGSNNFFDLDAYVFDDEYLALQSHLDDIGLPAGIEAPFPMKKGNSAIPFVSSNTQLEVSASQPNRVESSSSMAKRGDSDVQKRYKSFKKFDTVVDHSDHYYMNQSSAMQASLFVYYCFSPFDFHSHTCYLFQPPKDWAKRIQNEWKILEKDLPDTIFVRAYESRMNLLRAVIIGAEGTPYHDGLFFFDVHLPSSYPSSPPLVHYHSGGLRINPNLYNCGKVCLSLLNTWSGQAEEKWVPGTSTMLQVLVSIQGLILNMKPYYNEPGFAASSGSAYGETQSLQYNENTFILSLKTMVYTMNKPPKNFEDLVIGHFQHRVRDILMACKAYTEGVQVGCLVKGGVQDVDEGNKSCSAQFKHDVASYVKTLVAAFEKIGAKEAQEFLSLIVAPSPGLGPSIIPASPFYTPTWPGYGSHVYPVFHFNSVSGLGPGATPASPFYKPNTPAYTSNVNPPLHFSSTPAAYKPKYKHW